MATPRFNQNIIEASRRVQDPRTVASEADTPNHTYTAQMWQDWENLVLRQFVIEKSDATGAAFQHLFPELIKSSNSLAIASGMVQTPPDAFRVLQVLKDDLSRIFDRGTPEELAALQTGREIVFDGEGRFFQEGTNILLFPANLTGGVIAKYILTHTDIVIDGADDILLNSQYDGEIIERMVKIALADSARNANA